MTQILPPGLAHLTAALRPRSSTSSSWLTSMRRAWNVFLAGCPPLLLLAAGMAALMTSTSWRVVSMGALALVLQILRAILLAKR